MAKDSFKAHEGTAPLTNEGDDKNPWLDIPHEANWLPANDGKELVCGDCGLRKEVE